MGPRMPATSFDCVPCSPCSLGVPRGVVERFAATVQVRAAAVLAMADTPQRPEELQQLVDAMRALGVAPTAGALGEFLPRLRQMARRHLPAESVVRSLIDSEDLLQEGLLQLVRNVDQFRGGTWPEFLAFVHAILAQKKQQQARRHQVRAGEFDASPPQESLPSAQTTPSVDAMAQEDRLRLRQLIAALAEPYRTTLQLRLEGLDNEQLARRLGVSAEALRQRLSRAVRMLQERW